MHKQHSFVGGDNSTTRWRQKRRELFARIEDATAEILGVAEQDSRDDVGQGGGVIDTAATTGVHHPPPAGHGIFPTSQTSTSTEHEEQEQRRAQGQGQEEAPIAINTAAVPNTTGLSPSPLSSSLPGGVDRHVLTVATLGKLLYYCPNSSNDDEQ